MEALHGYGCFTQDVDPVNYNGGMKRTDQGWQFGLVSAKIRQFLPFLKAYVRQEKMSSENRQNHFWLQLNEICLFQFLKKDKLLLTRSSDLYLTKKL